MSQYLDTNRAKLGQDLSTAFAHSDRDAVRQILPKILAEAIDPSVLKRVAMQCASLNFLEEAEIILQAMVASDLNSVESLYNLALVKSLLGNNQEAINIYRSVLAIKPYDIDSIVNLSASLIEEKVFDEALSLCNQAIDLGINIESLWVNQGLTLNGLGKYEEALRAYSRALLLGPKKSYIYSNKSVPLLKLGRLEEAKNCCEEALRLDAFSKDAHSNLGLIFSAQKNYSDAVTSFKRAIEIAPLFSKAWINLGVAYKEMKLYEDALHATQQAIDLEPKNAEFWTNKGSILDRLGEFNEAITCQEKALEIDPDYAEAWRNKGVSLEGIADFKGAIKAYENALNLRPQFTDAKFNKSLLQLLNGDLLSGFEGYETRWSITGASPFKNVEIPLLRDLSNIAGKQVLVWGEQGFGDVIQFIRYLNELHKLGAKISIDLDNPIISLIKNSFDFVKKRSEAEEFDYQIPLLSMPYLFKTKLETIPASIPYLTPSQQAMDKWEKIFSTNKSDRKIGIACSGNPSYATNTSRSVSLEYFLPLLDFGSVFIIQKDLGIKDTELLKEINGFQCLGDSILSFDDSAAIVKNMDVIVSVDTSLAHLSGALAKETHILLPYPAEWRWLLDINHTPWYPTAHLYRRNTSNTWQKLIRDVANKLG